MSDVLEPGMRVLCIAACRLPPAAPESHYNALGTYFPKVGSIYTVREVGTSRHWYGEFLPSVRLVELQNRVALWVGGDIGEAWFEAHLFRPLRTRSTDISIFREIDAEIFGKERVSP